MNVTYLGDGLYAKFENCQIVLTANDPKFPTDKVYIEWPDIWYALVAFVKRSLDDAAGE